jgi:hypothetical protein
MREGAPAILKSVFCSDAPPTPASSGGFGTGIWYAVDAVQRFAEDLEELQLDYAQLRKFARAAHEFYVYIQFNLDSLINYGERYRAGEPVSSSIA